MEHILKTWGNTARFLLVLGVVLFSLLFFLSRIADHTEFNIDYSNDKTLITLIDKKNVIANSVLPACDCWSNTGIEIRPGEEYEIKVSGKIHATADKMIKDAEADALPRFGWIGPEGANNFRIRDDKRYKYSDSIRKTLLLSQKAKLGQVLFYFQKDNSNKPNCDIGLSFFNPDTVIVYDSDKGIKGKNTTNETWYLWAVVNDMLIKNFQEKSDELAYLGSAVGDTLKQKQLEWKKLSKENYNRIWFDDNFGNFVVGAKILKPQHILDFW
ncbi:hypothetical protein WG954_12120 [Lacibacter sp. H375]|uniref:hypothetical protein n=1 Tax=Lacibacter sp. H375 TaxID=3133424 RepID=UPI0030C57204